PATHSARPASALTLTIRFTTSSGSAVMVCRVCTTSPSAEPSRTRGFHPVRLMALKYSHADSLIFGGLTNPHHVVQFHESRTEPAQDIYRLCAMMPRVQNSLHDHISEARIKEAAFRIAVSHDARQVMRSQPQQEARPLPPGVCQTILQFAHADL